MRSERVLQVLGALVCVGGGSLLGVVVLADRAEWFYAVIGGIVGLLIFFKGIEVKP